MSMINSFIFGVSIAISIGPIAILIINRSVNCGLKQGMLSGLAAATADLTYALISFSAGAAITFVLKEYETWLHIISSLVLISFAAWMLRKSIIHYNKEIVVRDAGCDKVFFKTYLLTIGNPLTIILFTGYASQTGISKFAAILSGSLVLFVGSLLIQLFLAGLGGVLRKYVTNKSVIFYLNVASSLLIGMMGFFQLYQEG